MLQWRNELPDGCDAQHSQTILEIHCSRNVYLVPISTYLFIHLPLSPTLAPLPALFPQSNKKNTKMRFVFNVVTTDRRVGLNWCKGIWNVVRSERTICCYVAQAKIRELPLTLTPFIVTITAIFSALVS